MMNSHENERQSMIQLYSDFHKDAYGYRPRYDYSEYTLEHLKAEFARFERVCEENRMEDEVYTEKSIKEFEKRLESIINMGAGNRETALRWIVESYKAEDLCYGPEYIIYELGIGFNEYAHKLQKELEPLVAEYLATTV